MTEQAKEAIAADVAELIARYSFDLEGYGLDRWIDLWLHQYPMGWLSKAVIEALYQGRYKAVSVWQILELWQRRGKPVQHFSREFERMVSGRSLHLLFSESKPQQTVLSVPEPVLMVQSNREQSMAYNGNLTSREQSPPEQEVRPIWNTADSTASGAGLILPPRLQPARPVTQPSIQPFKPSKQFNLTLPGELRRAAAHSPIQQFVPATESVEMPDKLRAIAHSLIVDHSQATVAAIEAAKYPAAEPSSSPDPEQNEPTPEDEAN